MDLRSVYFFLLVVASVLLVSALTKGSVTLAPAGEADAPTIPSLLADVPRVTVLEQPDATKSSAPTIIVIVFLIFCLKLNRERAPKGNI